MANQSIHRAAVILSLFTLARPRLKITEIARALGLPLGTVHGLVKSLVEVGFLAQDPATREYRLGLRLNELGAAQMATLEINQKAAIPANYLARDTGLVVRVGVFERDAVVITYSTFPLTSGPTAPYLGTRVPAYCSSIGRAVLAFRPEEEVREHLDRVELIRYTPLTVTDRETVLAELARVRARGYARVTHEIIMHLDSVGAPIFGGGGTAVAGISVNGDPHRIEEADPARLARRVMDAAGEISGFLGRGFEPRFRGQGR